MTTIARLLGRLVLLAAFALLCLPATAAAGTYVVDGCADPVAVGGWGHLVRPTDGWYRERGVYPSTDDCPAGAAGRGLYVTMAGGPSFFRFDAPAATEIDRLTVFYRAHLSAAAAWAVPTLAVEAGHGGEWETIAPARGYIGGVPIDFGGWSSADARGADAVRFGVRCELQGPCVVGGEPEASFRALAVTIRDAHPPALALEAPAGHLGGVVGLTLAATDAGGGLYRIGVHAGDREVHDETLCATLTGAGERHVVRRVPCPGHAERNLRLDTRALADGQHRVVARAEDVAGGAREAQATIVVDNLPPGAGTVTLAGEPRVGEGLTAEVEGFSGQDVTYEHRWQRCLGSGCTDIGGATERTYAPRAGDAGHRLRARVLATDGGGTTTAFSALTEPMPSAAPTPAVPGEVIPPQSSGGGRAAAAGGATLTAWLERELRRVTRVTTRYGERVRIRGRLADGSGRPLGRTVVAVQERRDGGRWRAITGVRTRRDGRFTTFTKVGPSRHLRLTRDGAVVRLRQSVRAPVLLWRIRGGRLSGSVGGGWIPPRGVRVSLQVLAHGAWVTRALVRSDRHGRFASRTRFPGAVRVRAVVPGQAGYPFARGVSGSPR